MILQDPTRCFKKIAAAGVALCFFAFPEPTHARVRLVAGQVVFEFGFIAPGQEVYVASDLLRWDTSRIKAEEVSPGFYRAMLPQPWVPQLHYKLVVSGKWVHDQENPDAVPDGHGGFNARVTLPETPLDPALRPHPGTGYWRASELGLRDSFGKRRVVRIYEPDGAVIQALPGITVFTNDGADYGTRTALLNLAAHRAFQSQGYAMTLVLIPPGDRMTEYLMNDRYADWIHHTVIPEVDRKLGPGARDNRRVYLGASLGGLAALHHASRWPRDFYEIFAQSPSMQLLDAQAFRGLSERLAAFKVLVRLTAGVYETRDLLQASETFARSLREAGGTAEFTAFPCRHDWDCWNRELPQLFLPSHE